MSRKNIIRIEDLPPGAQAQARRQIENMDKRKWSNARKLTVDGETFDSKAEYVRWTYLKALQQTGEIHWLRRQCLTFYLGRDDRGRRMTWRPDATYDTTANPVVDESKGRRGRELGRTLQLFHTRYPEYRIVVNGEDVTDRIGV